MPAPLSLTVLWTLLLFQGDSSVPLCHNGKGSGGGLRVNYSPRDVISIYSLPSGSDLQGEIFASLWFGDRGSPVPCEASPSPLAGVTPQPLPPYKDFQPEPYDLSRRLLALEGGCHGNRRLGYL